MDRLEKKYSRMQSEQLLDLKKQNDAIGARVKSADMHNKLLKHQKHRTLLTEYEQIRQHLENKTVPHLTVKDVEKRRKELGMKLFGF